MGKIDNPPPEALDTPGLCELCGEKVTLRQVSEHLIDVHGKKAEDIQIEVSDTPFADEKGTG